MQYKYVVCTVKN